MITLVLILIWMHLLADFFLQASAMAKNKGSSDTWLSLHGILYTIPFLVFGWKFALVNGVTHWIIDWFTSGITSFFRKNEKYHLLLVTNGIDQALHLTILILTIPLMG